MTTFKQYIIEGKTQDGSTFRPSDWIDRLCTQASTFDGQHRLQHSPYLYPSTKDNKRCLILSEELREHNPKMYTHVMNFIHIHTLKHTAHTA